MPSNLYFDVIRTTSDNQDFQNLVVQLDKELGENYKDQFDFYHQYNQIENLIHVVVVYENGIARGCGAIKPYEENAMEVKRMFTAAKSRGKGVASAVLRELEKWAVELEKAQCILETGTKQLAAIAMYKKQGYVQIPNYGQYVGASDSVCFLKTIK